MPAGRGTYEAFAPVVIFVCYIREYMSFVVYIATLIAKLVTVEIWGVRKLTACGSN